MAENTPDSVADLIALAGDITIAWLQNPNVHPGAQDVPAFLTSMHAAITKLGSAAAPEPEAPAYEPAVSVRSSVKPDHLVSLIDGKKYKTLKRHLATNGLTPDEYRARYGLKSDYPMVAETYTAQRREIAKTLGLGRKPVPVSDAPQTAAVETVSEAPVTAPAKPKRAAGKAKAETPVAAASVPAKPRPAPKTTPKPTTGARKAKVEAEPETVTAPVVAETKPAAKAKRMARAATADAPVEGEATPTITPDSEAAAKPKRAPAKPKAEAKTGAAEKAATPAKPARVKKAKAEAAAEAPAEATQTQVPEA